MTPPTDEKLAEFIAELTRLPKYDDMWELALLGRDVVLINHERMFGDKYDIIPPIIRHLIEEEMKAKGADEFRYTIEFDPNLNTLYKCWLGMGQDYKTGEGNSKTKAVALAAYNALGGKTDGIS